MSRSRPRTVNGSGTNRYVGKADADDRVRFIPLVGVKWSNIANECSN